MSDTKVKVAVRVRPMNRRGKCTTMISLSQHLFLFAFDVCYISHCLVKVWDFNAIAAFSLNYEPQVTLENSLKAVKVK